MRLPCTKFLDCDTREASLLGSPWFQNIEEGRFTLIFGIHAVKLRSAVQFCFANTEADAQPKGFLCVFWVVSACFVGELSRFDRHRFLVVSNPGPPFEAVKTVFVAQCVQIGRFGLTLTHFGVSLGIPLV